MSTSQPPGFILPPPPPPPPGIPPVSTGSRGCWRTGLIGCGVVGLILLLGIVACFLYIRRNPQLITDWAMSQVDGHYAADVTEQDKKDLHDAYAAYRERLRSGKAATEPLDRVRGVFVSTGSNNEITRAQVHELTAAFRRGAGLPPLAPGEPARDGGSTAPSSGATPAPISTRSP